MIGKQCSMAVAYNLLIYLFWSSGGRLPIIDSIIYFCVFEWYLARTRQAVLFIENYCCLLAFYCCY